MISGLDPSSEAGYSEEGKTPAGKFDAVYHAVLWGMKPMQDEKIPEEMRMSNTVSCPDPKHWLIYEIQRISSVDKTK